MKIKSTSSAMIKPQSLSLRTLLTKRQKIIIASVIITIGLLSTQSVTIFFFRSRLIVILAILAAGLSIWALWEGMTKMKAMVLLILPTLFTLAVASFYFLLPIRWLTRLPIAVVFGASFYCLLLSQNVFNVAAIRTIPLYRAASTVAFLFTLITAFFLFNVILSLKLPFYWNGVVVALLSFPLVLQMLWSIEMERVTTQILIYSGIISMLIGEAAIALSFWPVVPTIWSMSLSTLMYTSLGLTTQILRERLTPQAIWEYGSIGIIVVIFITLITNWVG